MALLGFARGRTDAASIHPRGFDHDCPPVVPLVREEGEADPWLSLPLEQLQGLGVQRRGARPGVHLGLDGDGPAFGRGHRHPLPPADLGAGVGRGIRGRPLLSVSALHGDGAPALGAHQEDAISDVGHVRTGRHRGTRQGAGAAGAGRSFPLRPGPTDPCNVLASVGGAPVTGGRVRRHCHGNAPEGG